MNTLGPGLCFCVNTRALTKEQSAAFRRASFLAATPFIPPTTMALMMIPLVYLGIGAVSALGAGVGTALGFATGLQIRRWLPKSPPGEQHSTATVPLVHA